MSNIYNSFIPMAFDLTELNKRIEAKKSFIDQHITIVEETNRFLDLYDDHLSKGFKRDPKLPLLHMGPLIQISLLKPKKLLEKEYETTAVQVEAEYRAEVKANQALAVENMVNRILGEAETKQAKAQEEIQRQLANAARVEALMILNLPNEQESA